MNIEKRLNFDLKNNNTFKLSSVAKEAYFPKSEEELVFVLQNIQNARVIGAASNILFSSAGIEEPVIFTNALNKIKDKSNFLYVQAGVKSPVLSRYAAEHSLCGFEFLIAIPSSVGGNIFMNASAHGQCISDNLVSCLVFDRQNHKIKELLKEEINFSYRNSIFNENPERYVILGATFEQKNGQKEGIEEKIKEILKIRMQKQPSLKTPNAGSIFKNPKNESAGKLIEECGLKNEKVGGAVVSDIHANFIVNIQNATSDDITNLMLKIQNCVYNKFSIELEPEILFFGKKTEKEEKIWKKN